jgi:uncharacterized protein YdaU (DUF1376 family)
MPIPDGPPPSFQTYPKDLLTDRILSFMSHVAFAGFMRLRLHAWLSPEPGVLPDDDAILSTLSQLHGDWPKYRNEVGQAFEHRDGTWIERSLVRERARQLKRRSNASAGGRRRVKSMSRKERRQAASNASKARWAREKNRGTAEGDSGSSERASDASVMRSLASASAVASPSSAPSISEPAASLDVSAPTCHAVPGSPARPKESEER